MRTLRARTIVALLAMTLVAAAAAAETLLVEGKILQVGERGYILQIGTDPLAVEDTPETRFWRGKAEADRTKFKEGDTVQVRVKTTTDPPTLREIADKDSWKWLEANRKEPRTGTIDKIDTKYLTLKLPDGSLFKYRATDKSEVKLKGKASGSLSDLQAGQQVSVQGRTLANLDTWLVLVTDEAIQPKAKPTAKKKETPPPLPSTGKIEARILGHVPNLKMFDVVMGVRTLHISYNTDTKFFLKGAKAGPADLVKDVSCTIHYRRDRQGRILALKVELWR